MTDRLGMITMMALSSMATAQRDFVPFDDGSPRQRYPWVREQVEHTATPKPLTKRQKRRLRGKAQ
ncbi:MAG: hypothetical protein V4696_00820 [Pseudomonadota bacterium]